MAAARCSLLTFLARRPSAAALTAAAASGRAASPATVRAGRLVAAVRRLGTLHGATVVCSASGSSGSDGEGVMEVQLKVGSGVGRELGWWEGWPRILVHRQARTPAYT